MSTPTPPTDVAVIGAGAIGMAIAWRAARAGAEVTLVDDAPGRGASWAAAGMLTPVTEVHYGEEDVLRLNLASRDRWPSFAAELEADAGVPSGYRRCGTLVVARDRDDRAAIDELLAYHRRLELDVEVLTSRACRRIEPGLAPGVRGGLLAPDDHQIDNRALVEALAAACRRAGVHHVPARAVGLARDGDRVRGVRLPDATLPARVVVLAAGAWSATLEGVPPGTVPVRPVKGQLLHLRGPADLRLAERNIRGLEVYIVPRGDGRVTVGATVEERGHDTTVTAGAVLHLLRAAFELLPGITELELVEATAGLRPGTPDNAPIIGPGPLDGLVVATGHYRNGILLTPLTADVVAGYLATGKLPDEVGGFGPSRFAPNAALQR